MVRPSNREKILAAALEVVQDAGVRAVTFDSIAAHARLTRGGVMYHFPSRDALLIALHTHLAQRWETQLAAAAGKSAADCTATERLIAYIRISSRSSTKAELQLLLEASADPDHFRPWQQVLETWSPEISDEPTETELTRIVARLTADGLWMNDSLSGSPIPAGVRTALAQRIANVIDDGETNEQ